MPRKMAMGTTDLRTVQCPTHGETSANSGLLIEKYERAWVYLKCGHYYMPYSKTFKTANQF